MTDLKCHVIHCSSNTDHRCCRPDIKVDGQNARCSEDTRCASYTSIPTGATNNVGYKEPNPHMPIHCDAKNCAYNKDCMCTAKSIEMDGSNAQNMDQTACATFKCGNCG